MKKTIILGTLVLAGLILAPIPSQAVVVEQAKNTSDVNVKFEADDSKTDPVLPTEPGNPGTDNKGPLSLDYASNIQFGAQKISGGTTTYYSTNVTPTTKPYIQVTDKRGTGAGWLLTANMSKFTGKHKGADVFLTGVKLSFKNAKVKPGSVDNVSNAPTANQAVTLDATAAVPVVTATAEEMQGRGTFVAVFEGVQDISLTVPGGTAITGVDYRAQITWILGDTPQG